MPETYILRSLEKSSQGLAVFFLFSVGGLSTIWLVACFRALKGNDLRDKRIAIISFALIGPLAIHHLGNRTGDLGYLMFDLLFSWLLDLAIVTVVVVILQTFVHGSSTFWQRVQRLARESWASMKS